MNHLEIPVIILAFNRSDNVLKLLTKLREINAVNIYMSIDGARNERDAIEICKIKKYSKEFSIPNSNLLYRDINLGCKNAVVSGLDWFFDINDFGIILEDDCLPSDEFFKFAKEMLERFYDKKNIFCIQGNRYSAPSMSYDNLDLSINFYMWGWATWKDRWLQFRESSLDVTDFKINNGKESFFFNIYWQIIRQECLDGKFNSWGYPAALFCLNYEMFNITPPVNLVVNNGFNEDATHTKKFNKLSFNNFDYTQSYYLYSFENEVYDKSLFVDECRLRLGISNKTKIRLILFKCCKFLYPLITKVWELKS